MTRLDNGSLKSNEISTLEQVANEARVLAIEMTTLAKSGHIGGALGSVEMDAAIFHGASIDTKDPFKRGSDIIVSSAGHYSANHYAVLALGRYLPDKDEAAAHFRKAGSRYEGHVSHKVPTVWWDTGILGQGLSAGVGFALAYKVLGLNDAHVTVKMGDGEQTKGQIMEAARFASAYELDNITVVVDVNDNQLSGPCAKIMPMDIAGNFRTNGWNTIDASGNDIKSCWSALQKAKKKGLTAILSHTTMGKGVPEIENDYDYHGKPLPEDMAVKAIESLGGENRFYELERLREKDASTRDIGRPRPRINVKTGRSRFYREDTACRNAWGKALEDIFVENTQLIEQSQVVVIDCDLKGSVKTAGIAEDYPNRFFQAGIMEHHAGTMAGAMSVLGVVPFLADFGAFTVSEMYQQQRLNAINDTNLKLVSTHCGLDVGEDGKTHQAIDYLALNNHPNWQTFTPADANQTDRIVRYMAANYGNMHLAVGRSKIPVIRKQGSDEPFFERTYAFEPGRVDKLRDYGNDVVIATYGSMSHRAVEASERLDKMGIKSKVLSLSTPVNPDKEEILKAVTEDTKLVVTYEDHYVGQGNHGIAPLVKGWLYETSKRPEIASMGVTDFGVSGKSEDVYRHAGLHQDDLVEKATSIIND